MTFPSRTPEFRRSPLGRAQSAAAWAHHQARKFGSPDEHPGTAVFLRLHAQPCTYCGRDPAGGADHVFPLSRGGANAESNLVPACAACNRAKLFHTPEEWRAGTVVRMRTYRRAETCRRDPSHGRLLDWPTDRWAFHSTSKVVAEREPLPRAAAQLAQETAPAP